jgi:hypothetical protein
MSIFVDRNTYVYVNNKLSDTVLVRALVDIVFGYCSWNYQRLHTKRTERGNDYREPGTRSIGNIVTKSRTVKWAGHVTKFKK